MKKQARRPLDRLKPFLSLPTFVFLAFMLSSNKAPESKITKELNTISSPLLVEEAHSKSSFLACAADRISQGVKEETDFLVGAQQITALAAQNVAIVSCNKKIPVSTKISAAVNNSILIQNDTIPPKNQDDKVFTFVEQQSQFPGGLEEMYKFLAKNIIYPEAANNANLAGNVIAQFQVTKEGEIKDVKIVKSLSPETDAEVLRVISLMPAWTPGKQDGKPVNVQYTLPVRFSLRAVAAQETQNQVAAPSSADTVYSASPSAEGTVNTMGQQNPEYPGGLREMYRFLAENIKSPREDLTAVRPNAFAQGVVMVQFIVTKEGKVKDVNIVKSLSPRANAEVRRVISLMPKWTPGKLNGETVNVRYTLPIRFEPYR